MSAPKKVLFWNELKLTSFVSRETLRETYLESLLKLLVRKIIFCVYRGSFGRLKLAADKNCIHTVSTEWPKQKKISLESSFKAPDR